MGKTDPLKRYMSVRGSDLDDRGLVDRFKRTGDPDWFEPLFERHKKRIYGICRRILRDAPSAEDVLQETFKRAFERIGGFDESDPGCNFEGWLCTISRRLCVSEVRQRRLRPRPFGVEPVHDPPDEETLAAIRNLKAKLDSLPEEVRCCWAMFKLDGYTYAEIAQHTGYTLQQVKNHLRIARERMEARIK